MKHHIRILLTVLCLCMLPLLAPAHAQTYSDGNYEYVVLPDNTVQITHYYRNKREEPIRVPDTLGGYPVSSIGDKAFLANAAPEITLPDTVTNIGTMAFMSAKNLKRIHLPDALTSIGDSAFWKCSLLEDVAFPSSLENIGKHAFNECVSLINLVFSSNIETVGDSAFGECTGLKSVTFMGQVNSIGAFCFFRCTSLEEVFFEGGVTNIGETAFSSCESLWYVFLPEGLETIGDDAFRSTALTEVDLPSTLTYLGNSAFAGNEDLRKVTIEAGLKEIGAGCFGFCPALTDVSLSEMIETIGNGAFDTCPNLAYLSLPANLKVIGDEAFQRTALTRLMLPETVSIGSNAFPKDIKLFVVEGSAAEAYCAANQISYEAIGMSDSIHTANELFTEKALDPDNEAKAAIEAMLRGEASAAFFKTSERITEAIKQGDGAAGYMANVAWALMDFTGTPLLDRNDDRERELMTDIIMQAMEISSQNNTEAVTHYAQLLSDYLSVRLPDHQNNIYANTSEKAANSVSASSTVIDAIEIITTLKGSEKLFGKLDDAIELLEFLLSLMGTQEITLDEQWQLAELSVAYQLNMDFLNGLQALTPSDSLIHICCDDARNEIKSAFANLILNEKNLKRVLKVLLEFTTECGIEKIGECFGGAMLFRSVLLLSTGAKLMAPNLLNIAEAQIDITYLRLIHQQTESLLKHCYNTKSSGLYYSAILHNAVEQYSTECAYVCASQFGYTPAEAKSETAVRLLDELLTQYRYAISDRIALDRVFFSCLSIPETVQPSITITGPGALRIAADELCTVYLRDDGTAAYTGPNNHHEADVHQWANIIQVAAGLQCAAALSEYGQAFVADDHRNFLPVMTDVTYLAAGHMNVLGVKIDGTVENYGTHEVILPQMCHVKNCNWQNVVQADTGRYCCAGLTQDGKVLVEGDYLDQNGKWARATTYTELSIGGSKAKPVQVAVNEGRIVVLKEDGTVWVNFWQGDAVSSWQSIVQISTGAGIIIGLRSDGTVVLAYNAFVRHDYDAILAWQNVEQIVVGSSHIVAILDNGTLIAEGWNVDGQCDVDKLKP